MEGRDVEQDLVLAESWLRRAALAGDPEAAALVGDLYVKNGRLPPNYTEAAGWYRRAAKGVPEARYTYRRMLADGRGVTPDPEAARGWIARASAAGLREGQMALAEMLVNGRGGPRDTAAALEVFEQAAAEGHSGAMFALGALFVGGHDLPEDRMAAQRWSRAAAELGHGQVQLMLGRYLAEGVADTPDPVQARS